MNNSLPDRVSETFLDSTIFITGATGLVGKALLDKLLRYCDVKKIYILVREKKGKQPNERLKDLFKDALFKKLLEQKPEAPEKCTVVPGDVTEIDLGISEENRSVLTNEVNFIFHSAATVRFDDSLKYAVTMNTRGTKFALELAEQCRNLKLFIHISTAYAFPNQGDITYEKEYDPPGNPHEIISSFNWLKEESFTPEMTKKLLGDIPNTYTFSKALAEKLVYEKVGKIPLIICRPAIVIPAFKDPIPGWTNNIQGPSGLFVGAGKGVIRSLYMDSKTYANFGPADCTVSAIIMFAWHHLSSKSSSYIFNICMPQSDIQITWEEIFKTAREVVETKVPFNRILWYPGGQPTKSRFYNRVRQTLFQIIPALLIDFMLIIVGQKPILFSIQMRILKGLEVYEYYLTRPWNFDTTSIETVRKKLNSRELDNYQLDSDVKDVKQYLVDCTFYCRRQFLKETDDMLPAARRNMKIMYALDKAVKGFFLYIVMYYLYKLCLIFV
ncbi:unnamed protein product [Phyllotreta striolata]|uniref:Fatty acyl-CoA reductase n=1 Tax=Phyllotreta striolata TaxID=444603 RepID=A0A9N9TMY9_PHYSR|nr:unnamed protein product [Phyllotreta striolata]